MATSLEVSLAATAAHKLTIPALHALTDEQRDRLVGLLS